MHLSEVTLQDFLDEHQEFFEKQESKFNILLGLALRVKKSNDKRARMFSFGRPGAAALQMHERNLVLGDLGPDDCAELASHYSNLSYPGLVAPGQVGDWFVNAAGSEHFGPPVSQGIFQLDGNPKKPPVPGNVERAKDKYLLVKWLSAFHLEADIASKPPSREDLLQRTEQGDFFFWAVDGEPMAMAGIVREGVKGATIGAVYTPPEQRGHRYGEAVTAAVAEEILRKGKEFSSLYTNLENPISNKIYERIGIYETNRGAYGRGNFPRERRAHL